MSNSYNYSNSYMFTYIIKPNLLLYLLMKHVWIYQSSNLPIYIHIHVHYYIIKYYIITYYII